MITDNADLVGGSIDTTFASYPHTSATFKVLGLNTISFLLKPQRPSPFLSTNPQIKKELMVCFSFKRN